MTLDTLHLLSIHRYHRGINRTPYGALYGGPPRGGLKSLNLGELEGHIENEEELHQFNGVEETREEERAEEAVAEENAARHEAEREETVEEIGREEAVCEEEESERDLMNESSSKSSTSPEARPEAAHHRRCP